MSFHLTGRTALVLGASGGIGRAVACSLARNGADLILHGNSSRGRLETLLVELTAAWPESKIHTVFADLATEPGRADLIVDVSAICYSPDILVLTAGLDLMNKTLKQLSFEERLARLWQVDVVAAMQIARCFGQRMTQARRECIATEKTTTANNQGAIIFFGWDGVDCGMAGETAQLYAAAKGAVQGFARSFAKSVAPEVRVNCIAPGWIKTAWGETASAETNERVAAESLAQRWGTPEEVAELVCFLVSDAAVYINNQTLCINGGRT